MSLLLKKMNHEQGPPLPANTREEPQTLKTAWEYYNEGMEIIDREREKELIEEIDRSLILAALFTGFLGPFLPELLRRLEPDPMDIIQDVLIYQTRMMRNSSLEQYVPAAFSPPDYIVIVNALFYASLGVMILAAFTALLIKNWVREFDHGLRAISIPEQRAKTREFRYLGMERWRLTTVIGVLPLLFQISLLLFVIGLAIFLFNISTSSFRVTAAIFGIGVLYYATTTSISVFGTVSPYNSPLSRILRMVYQHVHASFCPSVNFFLSESMDTTPVTTLGRFRRHIQIFLMKSRPYRESYFVKPISATTLDEVHLSTAASALQRIHDSAPDSQHSEALHWSVWRIAGSSSHCVPPLLRLPNWIVYRENSEEYFSNLPPDVVAALSMVWLRHPYRGQLRTLLNVLRRVDDPKVRWAQFVASIHGHYHGNVTNAIRREGMNSQDTLWLLSKLSELGSLGLLWDSIRLEIGLAILSSQLSSSDHHCDIFILEAVVTLAAISCTTEIADRRRVLNNSREHPWLLLNIRNPTGLFEAAPSNKQFISLLFLVVYALIYRNSIPLAVNYCNIITAKGDLPLRISALAATAPSISNRGLSAIVRVLLAPQAQDLASIIDNSMRHGEYDAQRELLESYVLHFGASETPDPNLFAILLMLSKTLTSDTVSDLQNLDLNIQNPWLDLVTRVCARLGIRDGYYTLPMGLCYDQRFHNMIAALSLLRYTKGKVTQFRESVLLASFLQSREFAISSAALEYYMRTILSRSISSAPSCYLSGAVQAVFDPLLPDQQLWRGGAILMLFDDKFDDLPVEFCRTFAEAFFTLSRRPLPQSKGDIKTNTTRYELEDILTWEYFHAKQQKPVLTDSGFNGLDWMAMAWSFHISQVSRRRTKGPGRGEAQARGMSAPTDEEEFVLRALLKLLDAAPYNQIIPNIPKLREFVHWFDDTDVPEFRNMISARVEEALRRHQGFHKFHCTWYT